MHCHFVVPLLEDMAVDGIAKSFKPKVPLKDNSGTVRQSRHPRRQ